MTGAVCVYNGGQLSQMTVTTVTETADGQTTTETHTVDLTYDASGNPQTMTYDGTTYYYTVNIQGDVTGIVDENGNVLVRYTYQAYGTTYYYGVPTGSVGTTLRQINPLTYRGYVYDKETKLYYLQSRYYNRTSGRFINADALVITGQGLLGNNMFAYCGNNPVILSDKGGTKSEKCIYDFSVPSDPWKNNGGGSNRYIKSASAIPTKTIDITDRLNKAMYCHAIELYEYCVVFGNNSAAMYFAMQVKNGGEWDLKSENGWNIIPRFTYIYNGKELRYDDIGNIHYGFVGSVLFPETILLIGAGLVQIRSGTSSIWYISSYFDDPRDSDSIKYGVELWREWTSGCK